MALFVLISIFFILTFLSSEEEKKRILDTIFKLGCNVLEVLMFCFI